MRILEVEIKAPNDDIKKYEELLKKKFNGKMEKIKTQEDIYFSHPVRDFKKTDEALRIRIEKNKAILTYKGPKIDKVSKTREEIEVEFKDPEKMSRLLEHLGFRKIAEIRKLRRIYRVGEMKIVLDEVSELGTFLEVEIVVEEDKYKETLEKIFEFIEKIGIKKDKLIRKSYLELYIEKKSRK